MNVDFLVSEVRIGMKSAYLQPLFQELCTWTHSSTPAYDENVGFSVHSQTLPAESLIQVLSYRLRSLEPQFNNHYSVVYASPNGKLPHFQPTQFEKSTQLYSGRLNIE